MPAAKPRPKADILRGVEDQGLESLEDIFQVLLASALGLKVLVELTAAKPRNARLVGTAHKVGENGKLELARFEVWQFPPDTAMAKYLHEHLAGKAKVREEKQLDPNITVVFAADMTAKPELDEIEEEAARAGTAPIDWSKG